MHPTALSQTTIDRVTKRRGSVHAFKEIEPTKTALVVIDMQNCFCKPGSAGEVPLAREIVPNINKLAKQLRSAGGVVAWVQMTVKNKADWPIFLDLLVDEELAAHYLQDLLPGGEGQKLWPEMQTESPDLFVEKNRFSAFLPSACNLGAQLRGRGIDTVIIVGTLTNVCSESSGRDAAMSDFKTIIVSDGNACRSDDDHLATLNTFMQVFGDVYSTDELVAMIQDAQQRVRTAAE